MEISNFLEMSWKCSGKRPGHVLECLPGISWKCPGIFPETSWKLPRSCPTGSQRRPPWVGGGPLCHVWFQVIPFLSSNSWRLTALLLHCHQFFGAPAAPTGFLLIPVAWGGPKAHSPGRPQTLWPGTSRNLSADVTLGATDALAFGNDYLQWSRVFDFWSLL